MGYIISKVGQDDDWFFKLDHTDGGVVARMDWNEAADLCLKLMEELGMFIHEPDGCRGDCPCKQAP